jgi:hypothetical protein
VNRLPAVFFLLVLLVAAAAAAHIGSPNVFYTVRPVHWETSLEGAPPPDVARPVRGDAAHRVTLPYEFPRPGTYRLWVQVKSAGRVLTGVFEAEVLDRKG